MTNGVFFAPEGKFAAKSFFLFTKCGFRVVKSQTLATLSGGKLGSCLMYCTLDESPIVE